MLLYVVLEQSVLHALRPKIGDEFVEIQFRGLAFDGFDFVSVLVFGYGYRIGGERSEYSFVTAGSGYVSVLGVPTYYASSGYNPPTSFTGVVSATLPVGNSQFGFTGTTVSIPLNYPHKTFDFSLIYGASGLVPYTKTGSVSINVVPHIRSVSFSKASLVSNGIDNAVLSVNVLDRNGCSNVASVVANLSQLGGSATESLSFQSCAGDGVTATYASSQITTTGSAGLKTVTVTAYDSEGHANASDAYFSSDDLASSASITVNSPTAPVVTVTPISPSLIKGGVDSSITWSSSQTGTYLVYAGPSAACGSGASVASGDVTSASSNIVTPIPSTSLSEGTNRVVVCVTNAEPTEGSAFSTVTKDSSSPTVSFISSNNNIVTQDVTASFSATETGTYRAYVNGSYAGVAGSYDTAGQTAQIVIPNSAFTVDPGNNTLYVTVTDAAGNAGYSFDANVYKDGLPPDPVSSVSLADCDYVGNSATPCGALGNPRSGMSGRDFRVSWTPVSESTATTFESYQIFILPEGQPFTSSGLTVSKSVSALSQSGVSLDALTVSDSMGNPLVSSGSANYVAYVRVRKSNGLSSSATASSAVSITADSIEYPSFVSAAFVSNTEIAATYSKPLSSTLSDFDFSKFSSPSACFVRDSSFGTGAVSVSGSVVRFKIEPLGNSGKACSDLSVLPGSAKDFEGLFDEDVRTGLSVSDAQSPSLSISSPSNGAFVSGAGSFTLVYALSESMSGSTLFAKFTDGSGSVVSIPLSSKASAGNQNFAVSGPSAGLQDGKTYSLVIDGFDLSGNSAVSNTVTGIRYDVSPPSIPSPASPAVGAYVNDSTPALSWIGSVDNSTAEQNLLYEVQVSTTPDFSAMFAFANVSGTAQYVLSPSVSTNTGYYWRVRSVDEVGNSSFWSTTSNFVFDNVAPTVSGVSAWNEARSLSGYVKNGDSLRVSATVTDNLPNTLYATGMLANLASAGGGSSVAAGSFGGTATWTLPVSCSDGSKTVPLAISDLAGNVTNVSASFSCDNTPPSVNGTTVTYPSIGSYVSGGAQISVTWNPSFYSSEASPVSNPVTVDYSEDGISNWTQIASAVVNSGNASWTVPSHDSANAKIRLTATDKGQVAIVQRLGALVLVDVPGEAKVSGNLSSFEVGATKELKFSPQSSFESFPVSFSTKFKNEGNVHLKPSGKIEIVDENGEVLKGVGKEAVLSPLGAFVGEKLVDFVPVNDALGNVLPNSERRFDSLWEGFGYQVIGDDGMKTIKFKNLSEYYADKAAEKRQFLKFYESVHTRTVTKNFTAKLSLAYEAKDKSKKSFDESKQFQVSYEEQYVGVDFLVVLAILALLGSVGYYVFVAAPKAKEKMKKEILASMKK